MISGDSFSHACPSHVPTGRWTPPSRAIQKRAMRAPTRVHIRVRTMGAREDIRRAGVRQGTRAHAAGQAGERGRLAVVRQSTLGRAARCAAGCTTGVLFTREHVIHPKSRK
ncbi:hypothetical protein CRG98_043776 [Punica granatum]|uniref:Uncharacterized protein n=1 Tax=Punica granatum TaxID=22663 RepID=A0A2I0HW37_PUNGR|nr:hypothetical protein CRG98_043776 [Punica granatum]